MLLIAGDAAGVVVVRDHEVAVVGQAGPDEGRRLDAGRPLALTAELRRPQQRLGRDAAPVGAFAADQLELAQRQPLPGFRERVECDLPARTPADDDCVEALAHTDLPSETAAGTKNPA